MFLIGDNAVNFIKGDTFIENTRYPYDCALNFAVVGEYIIGSFKYADGELNNIIKKYNLKPINVRQGYAKCNICVVNDNAVITEDAGIAKSLKENNIDVLLLENKCVELPGYEYGFIGGSSGMYTKENGENIVLFCGDITKHTEYVQIYDFCKSHNATPLSLSDENLCDRGSIIIL
jgi:hypothetical protein